MLSNERIHGRSGALKDLLYKIDDPAINDLEDIYQFKKSYAEVRQEKLQASIKQVKLQISGMEVEQRQLEVERADTRQRKSEEVSQVISRFEADLGQPLRQNGFILVLFQRFLRSIRQFRLKRAKNNFQRVLDRASKKVDKRISRLEKNRNYIESNIQMVAEEKISADLRRFDGLLKKIEDEKPLEFGAAGEIRVIQKLSELPEGYYVINDYRNEFRSPIYNRAEDDRIYSVQVDHVVVGPTGVFVIETKNWSNQTISGNAFFSPAKQVQRAGFALFVLLNEGIRGRGISRLFSKWGERKISPRNIVVFINNVPQVQLQFVKFLGVERLNSYITYRRQIYSDEDVREIRDFLLEK